MSRLAPINLDQMTAEQRRVHDEIVSGPRGRVMGPYLILLKSPEAASRMQKVGEYFRFITKLPARLRMLAVLTTARAWTAQYEWQVHVPQALKAGLREDVIADLFARRRPSSLEPDETVVYNFCSQLQENKKVDDSAFRAALELFGEEGLVELTVLIGYFTAVAMTLNVFEMDVPDKTKPLLD